MTILIRTLFLSLMVGSAIFVNTATASADEPMGGIIDLAQVDLTIQVDINRSQLPPQLQNETAIVKIRNTKGQLVGSTQTTIGSLTTFSMKDLPEGTYNISVKIGGYTETEDFVFRENK